MTTSFFSDGVSKRGSGGGGGGLEFATMAAAGLSTASVSFLDDGVTTGPRLGEVTSDGRFISSVVCSFVVNCFGVVERLIPSSTTGEGLARRIATGETPLVGIRVFGGKALVVEVGEYCLD